MTARRPSPSPSTSAIRWISPRSTCRTASSQAALVAAGDRQSGRRDDQEAEPEFRPDRQPDLARPFRRSHRPEQLRLSADRRSAEAPARRRRRADFRRTALLHARLARSGQARQSRHHRGRRAERDGRAECPGRGRQDRPVAGAGGHGFRNAGQRPRPPQRSRPQFGDIVLRADPTGGAVVRLRDVARIELGALQYSSTAFFGEEPTVVLGVFQMPGSNALDLQKQRAGRRCSSSRSVSPRASPTPCITTRRASSRRRCMTC